MSSCLPVITETERSISVRHRAAQLELFATRLLGLASEATSRCSTKVSTTELLVSGVYMKKPILSSTGAALAILLIVCMVRLPSLQGAKSSNEKPESASSAPSANAPNKYALLVGINDYGHPESISPLAGSINDVEDMRQVLIGKFEFPPENILVLTGPQATHAAIIDAIKTHLIAKVQPGDIVVFDFSGHGSQAPAISGEKTADWMKLSFLMIRETLKAKCKTSVGRNCMLC